MINRSTGAGNKALASHWSRRASSHIGSSVVLS